MAGADGSPFVEDGGPGFDAEQAAAGANQVRDAQAAEARAENLEAFTVPEVPEEKVRQALFVGGDGLHAAVGVGEFDWIMTQRDLDRIAPPLARIINRYETVRAVAGYSDELSVAMGFGLWGWRSILERAAVLRAAEREASSSAPRQRPAPAPAPPVYEAPPAPPVRTQPSSPAPEPNSPNRQGEGPPAGAGGEHFPGAGAPREAPPAQFEVVDGYVTQAERIRQARERTPLAKPAEAPPAT